MISGNNDTICAPATPAGGGAICIVRVSGPDALSIADKVVSLRRGTIQSNVGYSLKMGEIRSEEGLTDEVLVSIFHSPHSYTGEDGVEISCHSSPYIVRKVLQLLIEAGCRMAEPGEFTQRAFLNGKMDLAQAEAVADLIAADSRQQHRVAMKQLKGGYSSHLKILRDKLTDIAALMELELDFSEEEVEFANRGELQSLMEDAIREIERLRDSFKEGNALRNGIPVAIVGAVNSGKSTLLNALTGDDRAIVSDIPGTTRDTIEECVNIDGKRFRFIDTAGLRKTDDIIEKIGIERSLDAISKASIILGLLDAQAGINDMIRDAFSLLAKAPADSTLLLLRNKMDIYPSFKTCGMSTEDISAAIREESDGMYAPEILDISARTGEGLDKLREKIAEAGKMSCGSETAAGDGILVTNLRHYEALTKALDELYKVRESFIGLSPTDLVAEDLRSAIRSLGHIWGEGDSITPDEILGKIFHKFCIGK